MGVSRRVLTRHIAIKLHSGRNRRDVVAGLAAYIVQYRLKSQLELIVADIAANLASLGHIEASVTTARPLDKALSDELIAYIKHIESADDVKLSEVVEPTLLGGVIVETPNKRFDASIRTKLKRLKNA